MNGNTNEHANQTPGNNVSVRRNQGRGNPGHDTTARLKGNIEGLATLGKHEERKGDSFLVFQKEMHDHIVTTYKHSRNIAYLMTTLQNPVPRFMKHMPTISKLETEWGIDSSITNFSQEQQETEGLCQPQVCPKKEHLQTIRTGLGTVH